MKKSLTELLKTFDSLSLQSMSREDLLLLYDDFANYQFSAEDSLDMISLLRFGKAMTDIEERLNEQTLTCPYLEEQLIENPAIVECVLLLRSLKDVLRAEKECAKIKSASLRKQFKNMIERRLESICEQTMLAN